MQLIELSDIEKIGLPLYEMKQIFNVKGDFKNVKISLISINPGQRVPAEGTGSHEEDEYSVFLDGELYTESGDFKGMVGRGYATLIPMKEAHWCENRSDKPCMLACVMVGK